MTPASTNPVAVAVLAAVHAGKVWDESGRESFAQRVAAILDSEGVEVSDWKGAVSSLGDLDQTPAVRNQAARMLRQHRGVLDRVADLVPEVARTRSVKPSGTHSERVADWMFQNGLEPGVPSSIGEVFLDPRFLEAGRFASLPGGVELPCEIYVAPGGPDQARPIPVRSSASPYLEALGQSMTEQWGFLYERASRRANDGALNVNTLTRYAYNCFGVRRILQDLEERDVRGARILLVTGYETPVHELVESDRVGEVLAVDLSRKACEVIAEKYAGHPNAEKLRFKLLDYSGLDPRFQGCETKELAQELNNDRLRFDAVRQHFSSIASGQQFVALDLKSDSFEAVHLPFVLGSLHLTPLTLVIAHYRAATGQTERIDYEDFIGKLALATSEAQRSVLAVTGHALSETRRILKPGGLMMINLWGRPLPDAPRMVRLSDTVVSAAGLGELLDGCQRLFSGNPQPAAPQTVGHILASHA